MSRPTKDLPMTSATVTIREATARDAAELAELGARTFRATYTGAMPTGALEEFVRVQFGTQQQAGELADPACRVLVAEHDRTMVGYVLLRACAPPIDAAAGATMQLARLYVDAEAQSRGVGADLFAQAVDIAEVSGHERLWLTVWEHNTRAAAVYRRWGFTDVGEIAFDLAGEVQRDRVLVRAIG